MGSWGLGLSLDNLSLGNYQTVFGDRRTLGAIWTSTWLAAAAATICVVVAAVAIYMRDRSSLPGRRALPFLAELPYAIPGTVLAMGFLLAFSQEIWLGLTDILYVRVLLLNTAWMLLVAYCVKYLAFGLRSADAALTQIDRSLEEAARTSGASPLQVFMEIVAPIMRPALVAAWVLIFLPVLGEITMSILLFGPQTRTLGVLLFDYQSYESPPKAAVLASLLAVAVLLGNYAVKKLSGGKLGI
jgi:iron(III) transport system permease protein